MKWFERTELLLGEEKINKLKRSHVLVVGLGGVGGAASEQLVRSGIGKLTIVDADTISLSNLNRQVISLRSNIGKNKTDEFKLRLLNINPELKLNTITEFLRDERLEEVLLNEKYDYIIDAIDTLSPKINLIRICYENKLDFISSMGAGGKTNPEMVKIADISKSNNCNLARIIRKRIHRLGIYNGFDVIYSDEKVDKNCIIEEESTNKKSNVGTISYMPVIFGCFASAHVIKKILE